MLNILDRLIQLIHVHEDGDEIVITNFHGTGYVKALQMCFGKRFSTQMINDHSFRMIRFYRFFAIDFVKITEKMIEMANRDGYSINVRAYQRVIELMRTYTWLNKAENGTRTRKLRLDRLSEFNYQPKPFQMDWIKYYDHVVPQYQLRGALLNAAPGAGKTFIAYLMARLLDVDLMIVVGMKQTVESVWAGEPKKCFKKVPKVWHSLMDQPYQQEPYIIIHYEYLRKLIDFLPEVQHKKILIVLDESHNLTDLDAERTQNFLELCEKTKAKDIIWASGTPIG